MSKKLHDIVFHNGHTMPIIGLGTWQSTGDDVAKAVETALQVGYRHIDTAYSYQNEAQIGEVLKKWISSGAISREDLFIVTKLPPCGNHPERVEKYIKKSLAALQLEYVDLYLIHHPVGAQEVEGNALGMTNDGHILLDMETNHLELWKKPSLEQNYCYRQWAMEAQVDAGLTRSIGLSNFNSQQIKRIWDAAQIKPTNLQVELHVYFQQRELVAFCKALDITVVAYGPLGSQQMYQIVQNRWGTADKIPKQNPLTDPVVKHIAEKYKKTTAQVLLRYIMQHGIAVIPKSTNPDRIKQNYDVFIILDNILQKAKEVSAVFARL